MEKQAGKDGEKLPSVEELLQQAGGRSKFDPFQADIERLVAGGVRQRVIADWLAKQGVKVAAGELSHWLIRRRNQRAKQQQAAEDLSEVGRPGDAFATPRASVSRPDNRAPHPTPPHSPTAPTPEVDRALRSPDERSGTTAAERELDEQVEAALEAARRNRGRRSPRISGNPTE